MPIGATVTSQYLDQGVEFISDVFTTDDDAAADNPTLSGAPRFFGPISAKFTRPGTATPATVAGFSLDVGYINNRNSVDVDFFDSTGRQVGSTTAQSQGFNHIDISYVGVASFTVTATLDEPAGFEIDNLLVKRTVMGTKPTRMVSLGDSYSSGEGLVNSFLDKDPLRYDCGTDLFPGLYYADSSVRYLFDAGPLDCDTRNMTTRIPAGFYSRRPKVYSNTCHRAGSAYPNQIRVKLGLKAQQSLFVACSGAWTADVLSKAQHSLSPVNVAGGETQLATARQFARRVGQPNLITIGIGGNDIGVSGDAPEDPGGLAALIKQCILHACAAQVSGMQAVVDSINGQVYSNVYNTLSKVRSTFPSATVAAFGYPQSIGDPAKHCKSKFDVAGGIGSIDEPERVWLKESVLPALNSAIADAAAAAGVTFIDISGVTLGHEICSSHEWINGVRYGLNPSRNFAVGVESFHPNQDGHDAIAKWFVSHYTSAGRLAFTNPPPRTTIRPATSSEIHLGTLQAGAVEACGQGCSAPVPCLQGCPLRVQGGGYSPGSRLRVTIRSAPRTLGFVTANAHGEVRKRFKLPRSVQPGLHAVEIDGADTQGNDQSGSAFLRVYRHRPRTLVKLGLKLVTTKRQHLVSRGTKIECRMTLRASCVVTVKVRLGDRWLTAKAVGRPARGGFVTVVPRFSSAQAARIHRALLQRGTLKENIRAEATYERQVARATGQMRIARR